MKAILVAVEPHDHLQSLLETSCLLAEKHGSYVEGYTPRPILPGFVGDAGLVAINEVEDPKATEEDARKEFEAFMQNRGLTTPETRDRASYGWSDASGKVGSSLSEIARVFDITMIGRPAFGSTSPLMSTLEPVLFESGRPIMVAPPTPPKSVGNTIVIAWNRSTEAATATAYAMPLLKVADRVVVMTVEGAMVPGPSGKEAVRHLARNGVQAETIHVEDGNRSPGEALMAEATAMGCDLIIKGAYTQSRLRQMFFGGQTRYLLTSATVPLFMSH